MISKLNNNIKTQEELKQVSGGIIIDDEGRTEIEESAGGIRPHPIIIV